MSVFGPSIAHHRHTTHVHHGPQTHEVHEHRAPTDDSIRLAEEFREKARKALIGTIPAPNHTFTCEADVWYDGLRGKKVGIRYKLNGFEGGFEFRVDMGRMFGVTSEDAREEEMIRQIHEAFASHLATDMLSWLMPHLRRNALPLLRETR